MAQPIERFRGTAGRGRLLQALRAQKVVNEDAIVASALRERVVLKEFRPGQELISQGESGNSLYFLLWGRVAVLVNGREVATRTAGDHVGEMALLQGTAPRSATVVASLPTVAARITEQAFTRIADAYPFLWRRLAMELAERLRQRGKFHTLPNARPVLFIGSASEALPLARAIKNGLKGKPIDVRLWSDGVFGGSQHAMESLEAQLAVADFALLVTTPDDEVTSRGRTTRAPRDNVVFELGLFMGAISRHRTYLLTPSGVDVKIPSDLLGINRLQYNPKVRSRAKATAAARRELLRLTRAFQPR